MATHSHEKLKERIRRRENARALRGLDAIAVLRMASKSIWRERFTQDFRFFCPMCSAPRRIGMHPKPGQPIHFVQIGITTLVVAIGMNLRWPWIGVKALVAFIPLWVVFEVIYRAKVRASVTCRKCGFDPVLYLADVDRTRDAIRDHWRKRFEEKGIPFPGDEAENAATHSDEEIASHAASESESRGETESEA